MNTAHDCLTVQLLDWIIERPRSYAQLMEGWRTTCPRMAIWEDACAEGLIDCEPGPNGIVSATTKGLRFRRDHSPAVEGSAPAGQAVARGG